MLIPRIFHTIWVQGELPEGYRKWHESWLEFNPDWEHRLWSEPDYLPLVEQSPVADIYKTAVNHAQRAEIVSRVLVYEYGGVWVDADFQCLKNVEPIISDCDIFCGEETQGGLSAGIWGATPKHPLIKVVLDDIERSILKQREEGLPQTKGAGPWILRRLWAGNPAIKVFPPEVFYPYNWMQADPGEYGDAYAVHHWAATWKDGS